MAQPTIAVNVKSVKRRGNHLDVTFTGAKVTMTIEAYAQHNTGFARGIKHLVINFDNGPVFFKLNGQTDSDRHRKGQHIVEFVNGGQDGLSFASMICHAILKYVDEMTDEVGVFARQVFTKDARADIQMLAEGRMKR